MDVTLRALPSAFPLFSVVSSMILLYIYTDIMLKLHNMYLSICINNNVAAIFMPNLDDVILSADLISYNVSIALIDPKSIWKTSILKVVWLSSC